VRGAERQLAPGEWAVLALLAEGPTHGFAIARAMAEDGEVGRVWSSPRPRVYYAIDALTRQGLARPGRIESSRIGPDRTILRATPAGCRAVAGWLDTPVERIRDARSLLLLKLLFLDRANADPRPLLRAQRERFQSIADRFRGLADEAEGFDRTLLLWRLESATAAVRFIDSVDDSAARADRTGAPEQSGASMTSR
jgi:DNA-binding PadR family transcriptional regulator